MPSFRTAASVEKKAIATRVKGLFLRGAYSNVSDVSELARWENLQSLNLEETGVTDISPLAKLRLVSLNLKKTPVGSLEPIRGMTSLEGLYLSRVECDLSPVASLPNLTHLDLSFTTIPDLSLVAGLSKLVKLDLWGCTVTDLGPLAGKPIADLSLTHMPVKPDLRPLFETPALGRLCLIGTQADDAQVAALQAKLPDLYVSR